MQHNVIARLNSIYCFQSVCLWLGLCHICEWPQLFCFWTCLPHCQWAKKTRLRDASGGGPFDEAQMHLHTSNLVALSLAYVASTTASTVKFLNDIRRKHFWNIIFRKKVHPYLASWKGQINANCLWPLRWFFTKYFDIELLLSLSSEFKDLSFLDPDDKSLLSIFQNLRRVQIPL